MKIMELNTKEYEMLVKKGLVEEEKKIPEKLSTWFSVENVQNNGVDKTEFIIKYANHNFETYFNKINEIIDYLKSKGE